MVPETNDPSWVRLEDGRRLHHQCVGSGTPTVVFEAGLGVSGSMWAAVTPAVSARTTTVVYDRSGLGLSPPDPAPRNLARLVDDHVELLGHLGRGPFVLVGHSWGGLVIRAAAARRPDDIAGLVLVDATDEGCDLFFSKGNERQTRMMLALGPTVARLGLMHLAMNRLAARLPEPAAGTMRRYDGTVSAARTQAAELATSVDDLRALRADPPVLPDVPVTVLSGMRSSRLERGRRAELLDAHRARAAALPQGRLVGAEESSHYIPFTEPDLVAAEILRVVDLAEPSGADDRTTKEPS